MLSSKEQQSSIARLINAAERFTAAKEKEAEAPKAQNSDTPKLTVETIHNHVYFYADVDSDRTLALIREIRAMDNQLREERSSRMLPKDIPPTPIWLHIQSGGGYLFAGLSAADQLQMIKSPIYSIVEGYVASAATVISLACDKRYILPNAFFMIHEFSSHMWGKYRDFEDDMVLQKMLMEVMVNFYHERTKLSKKQVRKLLDHDSWFNAEQCIANGFCDKILN